MKKILIIPFLILAGCGSPRSKTDEIKITGLIKSVELNCRADSYKSHSLYDNMSMWFYLELENKGQEAVSIEELIKPINDLDITYIEPTFYLILDSNYQTPELAHLPAPLNPKLIATESSVKSKLLNAHSKITLKCRLLSFVYGNSLKSASGFYNDFFKSSFSIKSIPIGNKGNTIIFEKSKYFEIVLKLDGKVISPIDTIFMNKKHKIPTIEEVVNEINQVR